jgi:hypothetical protein
MLSLNLFKVRRFQTNLERKKFSKPSFFLNYLYPGPIRGGAEGGNLPRAPSVRGAPKFGKKMIWNDISIGFRKNFLNLSLQVLVQKRFWQCNLRRICPEKFF